MSKRGNNFSYIQNFLYSTMSYQKIHHLIKKYISDFHPIFSSSCNNNHFRITYLTQYSLGSSSINNRRKSGEKRPLISSFFFIIFLVVPHFIHYFIPQQFEELSRILPALFLVFSLFIQVLFSLLSLHSALGNLFYDTRKNVKKHLKNRRKSGVF